MSDIDTAVVDWSESWSTIDCNRARRDETMASSAMAKMPLRRGRNQVHRRKTVSRDRVNDDLRARRPIQQPLEVEARELILRFFAGRGRRTQQGRQKRRLPAWHMHSNNLLLLRCCVFGAKRFKCSQSFSLAPRYKVALPDSREVSTLPASVALTQMRVPSCLLAPPDRAATLMVSP